VTTLILVGCCGAKLDHPAPAKDLYQSQLFKKGRAWAERHGDAWMILSALHGAVDPERIIAPYDWKMKQTKAYRRDWGLNVRYKLQKQHPTKIICLAGNDYCFVWPSYFPDIPIEFPLFGMGVGKRLAWLTHNLGDRNASSCNR
jgi:hypothetical protein